MARNRIDKGRAHREAVQRYQADHRARGLCTLCSEPAARGGTRCESHRKGKSRAARGCGTCGEPGHDRRTCPADGMITP